MPICTSLLSRYKEDGFYRYNVQLVYAHGKSFRSKLLAYQKLTHLMSMILLLTEHCIDTII